MFEEAISAISIWSSMDTWLTPTVLFLLLNLMIATIALSSAFSSVHKPPPPPPHLSRTSSVLHRLKSLNLYSYIHSPQPPVTEIHHQAPPPAPIQLQSTPEDDGPTLEEVYTRITQKQSVPQYVRHNSDTKPAGGEVPVRLPAKMKKSASDKSAFNHFEAVSEIESTAVVEEMVDEVDVRAGDFINRFREHLKMQRLESIVRYKDMITRGSHK